MREAQRLTGGSPAERAALLEAPLEALLSEARQLRAHGRGALVTFSPKVFLPLTRVCRDVGDARTSGRPPRAGQQVFTAMEDVLGVARAAAASGCREAVFTLRDKPELRSRVAREELEALRCETTVEYLARAARAVFEETGLLPHLNLGVLGREELVRLRPVVASMGVLLDSVPPDEVAVARLETIRLAGELRVPFTTGIRIGMGATRAERLEALLAIKALSTEYGHVQAVVIESFVSKRVAMMGSAAPALVEELTWTCAVARILLGPHQSIQATPSVRFDVARLLDAGIDDLGGIPPARDDREFPWPAITRLRRVTEEHGLQLAPRLVVRPSHMASEWIDSDVRRHVLRASDSHGLARTDDWAPGAEGSVPFMPRDALPVDTRDELGTDEIVRLFRARDEELHRVLAAADRKRREVCGDTVSYVVTRNIQYTNVCYFRCGFCAFSKGKLARNLRGRPYLVPLEEIARRAKEAWDRGATEVCLQGGIHPRFDGAFYRSVVSTIKDAVPDIHVHAFSALEVWQGAATEGRSVPVYLAGLLEAGLSSLPGTAAEVLDDRVRAVICPDKISSREWLEVHDAAHRAGLRSNNTIMFGHVDGPEHWARHLLAVAEQQRRTGGFTEFVPLPFVHMEAPIYLRGQARPGPTFAEVLLMHAVGRLALHPHITNVQASWVKLGPDGVAAALKAGVNDLGGTLMNESISRAAGARFGQEMVPERMEALIRSCGRVPRQRTTLYADAPAERRRASFGAAPCQEPVDIPVAEAHLSAPARRLRPSPVGDALGPLA